MMNTTNLSLQEEDVEVDDEATTSKKDQILERLNKRNKERQNYLDVKLEQRHKDNIYSEGADYFSQIFADKVREIEIRVKNISEASAKKSVGDGPCIDMVHHFSDITIEIQELQRYLTNSTMFLTDFKIKACQGIINDLLQTCEETKVKLIPKKKFGFSGRKVTPKPTLNPKISKTDKADGAEKGNLLTTSNKVNWTLCGEVDEYISLKGDDVDSKDITIANLQNCFVEIQGSAGSVQISNCSNCTFLCGPISRSLFADFCSNCLLNVACQQMRFHTSTQCRIYLHVTCRAIIEDCTGIEVAPYNYEYSSIKKDFETANLNKELNNYKDIADFNWLSPNVPSPNWNLLKDCSSVNWHEKRRQFILRYADNSLL